jgi:hypothetical protein
MSMFSIRKLLTVGIMLSTVMTMAAFAQAGNADSIMAKCMVLTIVNDLELSKDQMQTMANIASQFEKDREAGKQARNAVLEPFYQKLVAGEKVDPEDIHDALADMPKPAKGNHAEMRKQVDAFWATLTSDQQETLRDMEMPGMMNKGPQGTHGMMGSGPEGMAPPPGTPFEGRLDQAPAGNRDGMLYMTADTATPDSTTIQAKAAKGKKGRKAKKDPGVMKLNHLLMMPGTSEALTDRMAHM